MRTSHNIYGHGFQDYLRLNGKPKPNNASVAFTKAAVELLRAYKKTNAILYYLIVEMGIKSVRTMYNSSMKTTHLLKSLLYDLSIYGVPDEWEKFLKREVTSCTNRVTHIRRITYENLNLTEEWCYFKAEGMQKLDDVILQPDMDEQLNEVKKCAEEYKKTHQEEVRKHMEEVQPLIDALKADRERIRLQDLAEKEERKRERREANAEVKEIKKNRERWKKVSNMALERRLAYLNKLERSLNEPN